MLTVFHKNELLTDEIAMNKDNFTIAPGIFQKTLKHHFIDIIAQSNGYRELSI